MARPTVDARPAGVMATSAQGSSRKTVRRIDAGAASIAKVTLAIYNDKLPPSINYAGPNPYIDFDKEHLKVASEVTEWPRYSGHKIAGVSGFGFGGANAHIVVREVLPSDLVEPEPVRSRSPRAGRRCRCGLRRWRADGRVRRVHPR